MAAQKPLDIPNQDILDFEYDDFTEDEETPKTPTRPGGKSIRIDQPPTDLLDIPSSPTDSNIIMEEVSQNTAVPDGKHASKLQVLTTMLNRARTLILNNEPFHTMINEGYNLELTKPQLSYKILSADGQDLLDFEVNPNDMSMDPTQNQNQIPFFELEENKNVTQTDISYHFSIKPLTQRPKTEMKHQSTHMTDASIMNPIIDSIKQSAPALVNSSLVDKQYQARSITTNTIRTPSLSSSAPPRHGPGPSPRDLQAKAQRSRPQDRLGPPIRNNDHLQDHFNFCPTSNPYMVLISATHGCSTL
ncbi:hypothetical protein DAPPUDRAFT_277962 [Daphnia pulex]|uniref:Uncharacterized protein n=1 Tax=Daphnia pulex TaxID=6669 RepID=E9I6N4_DAPPU|nr:hypothetical protein DAPPUDRAFT_277962 [Daphnia pulex]|eukprot:EFX60346.1 hypothetical protein DAPPUDRAFT_277962 [Daphnia pulex]